MKSPDFIEVYENAIPSQLCDAIVKVFDTQEVLKPIQGSQQVMNPGESGEL